ncbi:MAG: cell division protein FtsK [Candidatus Moranbacteria bacterium CG_4_10_14_3_um_filter_44_15]|nr:MAG: cell division protein FtsK [Candidatus Moranbacteria bacterium CG06_land_8_20_14_3_00_43_56]PIV83665.1 MAG: cell division protein FtsK [Candidatus Moranbacteria bacterium CG17_big_fil_post_rev_8_21_14_2_50_44_12]PIX90482.1 MAG: cell division protein FtsK [Candidatus Moranbacteria bacterium CG_4_10_14_3_um_filter_44_15]PJA85822.1 MAG: cell division protein FtsK [Candidatus Moranbacteria bacterium CG_4_9_14_3_um_filter_44_28]
MGRRKKKKDKENWNGNGRRRRSKISMDTKRSIIAVLLIALAILSVFSLFGGAGAFGTYLNKILALAFGAGRFLLPLLLAIVGFMYFRRGTESYYVFVTAGFILFFASVLGIIHIFHPLLKMLEIAKSGQGGGFLGTAAAYPVLHLFGFWAGLVVLLAIALASLLLALNVPFRALVKPVEWIKEKEDEAEDERGEEGREEPKITIEEKPSAAARISEMLKRRPEKIVPEKGMPVSERQRMIAGWKLPPLNLLERTTGTAKAGDIEANAKIIQKTLKNFGIDVEIGEISVGPSVTQYCFKPAAGVKLSKITTLNNDLSLALAQHPIRIEAPIPQKSLIGIEVPNKVPTLVRLRDILESTDFSERKSNLTVALGQDVAGNYILSDVSTMPHLMIAGATGTGKSICINTIITSLLYQNSPDDLKFILIDPKRVELTAFNGIPHLLTPTVVDNGKVANALKWVIGQMEERYKMLQDSGSRNIFSYNEKIKGGRKKEIVDEETGEITDKEEKRLPFIVIIIDELADIMASHAKEVEAAIVRIAQMARAVGIHLIVSTQRPSVEVLTGLIKANITTRIAFQVATQIDSRTILDMAGSEKLLGNGDMLYLSARSPKPKRIQGVFVSESEVRRVVKSIRSQLKEEVEYDEGVTAPQKLSFGAKGLAFFGGGGEGEDELYEEAEETIMRAGKASASLLQRRLRVGYARAARLLDILEANGVIGPADGSKPREVLIESGRRDIGQSEVGYEDEPKDQKTRERWQM